MVFISLLVLAGLVIGGLIGLGINRLIKEVHKVVFIFRCTGIRIVFFEMIPESFLMLDWFLVSISIFCGLVFMHLVHLFMENKEKNRITYGAFFLTIAIAIHNLPSGIAIGSNVENQGLSNELTLSFVAHQIPKGLALFLAFSRAVKSIRGGLFYIGVSILLVACFFVALLLGKNPLFQAVSLRAIFTGMSIGTLAYASIALIFGSVRQVVTNQSVHFLWLGFVSVFLFIHFVSFH